MAQVDYVHFFNNSFWIFFQFMGFYIFICLLFVQYFYKILRLRWKVVRYFYIFLTKKLSWLLRVIFIYLNIKNFLIKNFKELNYEIPTSKINSVLWFYG